MYRYAALKDSIADFISLGRARYDEKQSKSVLGEVDKPEACGSGPAAPIVE